MSIPTTWTAESVAQKIGMPPAGIQDARNQRRRAAAYASAIVPGTGHLNREAESGTIGILAFN